MITVEHGYIRFSEADDVPFLRQLYLEKPRRAALLDTRREPIMPSAQELREMLARKDAVQGLMYTVEDNTGMLKGWCGLRGINYEARYAELVLLFASGESYGDALADETLDYLLGRAFRHFMLHKVLVLCLNTEPELRAYLKRKGFIHAGAQRQALFSGGVWNDLNMFTLSAPDDAPQNAEMTAGAIAS